MNSAVKSVKTEETFVKYLNEKLKGKRLPAPLIAAMLIIGVLIAYAHNSSPAPFIPYFFDYFTLDPVQDQALINLSMSIMFLATIPATFIGTAMEQKIGTRNLFTIAMLLNTIGILMVFLSPAGYGVYLVGRVIYGFGFGLCIPSLGSAIMKWFRPKSRRLLATLNGFFPLGGALLSYTLFPGVGSLAGSWVTGQAFSGFITLAILIIWLIAIRKDVDTIDIATEEDVYMEVQQPLDEKGVVRWAFGTNMIKTLVPTFICDFTMYMYIATILPYWLMTAGSMDEMSATWWAAIAFPLFGVIGTAIGAVLTSSMGKRKPVIVFCQVLKLAGFIVAVFGADVSITYIIIGIAMFGLGNGGWMPPLFIAPTELPGTSASKVAACYSIFLSFGYIAGFIMPIVGGLIATAICNSYIASSGITDANVVGAYGYKWSVMILALSHIIAIIFSLRFKETGPGRKKKEPVAEAA